MKVITLRTSDFGWFFCLAILVMGLTLRGQPQLYFSAGAKQSSPPAFAATVSPGGDEIQDNLIAQSDIGVLLPLDSYSIWMLEGSLSYRYAQDVEVQEMGMHPERGLVQGLSSNRQFHWGGLQLGMAYNYEFPIARHRLILSGGLQWYLPFASRKSIDGKHEEKLFRGDDFWKGMYYGLYLRPTYQYIINQRWAASAYVEIDALGQHDFSRGLILAYGGGLRLTYAF